MTAPAIRFYQTGSFAVGNRLLDPEQRSVQAGEQRTNSITCGHRACQGCGEALGARYALDAAMRATGGRMIAANATGCLEVFSTPYPESSWRIPWIHSLFGNAPAVSTGIAAALRAKGREDIRVVGQGGDGGTVDIGMACLSGMFERNDDVLYICYDNEAYMNTGVQRSGATPPAARTATTQAVGPEPGNVFGQGKSAPLIAMAHEIPYVATATVAELRDLEAKVQTAMELRGARYLHVFVPCPLGWGSASKDTIRIARLAKESGIFPVFEARDGELCGVSEIRRQVPVEEYLRPQKRFAHLFEPELHSEVIARIQAGADRNIRRFGLLGERPSLGERRGEQGAVSNGGQAVRDHARRRFEPRQQDGLLAAGAARVRAPAAAVQPRLPGRREHPAVALPRRVRRLRDRVARAGQGQPAARCDGPRLLPPVRDRLQPRAARRRRRHPRRRALPRRRGDPPGLATDRGRRADRQARARRRRRSLRPVGGLPARAARAHGHDPRRGADRRRHDALRHPHATACRATSWTPRSRASSTSGSRSNWTARSRASSTRCETAASTRRSWPSARTSASVHTFPPGRPRTSSTR